MGAGRYDRLEVEQGATFELTITVPYDLTDGLARAKAKLAYADVDPMITFDVEIAGITATSVTATKLIMRASASATEAMELGECPQGFLPGVWDLEIITAPTADNNVTRVLEGRCKFKPEASTD